MKWLADENFANDILRRVRRRAADFDFIRVQDISKLSGCDDAAVLTHDLSTMIPAMRDHLRLFPTCAPIALVPDSVPISRVIDDLLLLDERSVEADWASGAVYLPLG